MRVCAAAVSVAGKMDVRVGREDLLGCCSWSMQSDNQGLTARGAYLPVLGASKSRTVLFVVQFCLHVSPLVTLR